MITSKQQSLYMHSVDMSFPFHTQAIGNKNELQIQRPIYGRNKWLCMAFQGSRCVGTIFHNKAQLGTRVSSSLSMTKQQKVCLNYLWLWILKHIFTCHFFTITDWKSSVIKVSGNCCQRPGLVAFWTPKAKQNCQNKTAFGSRAG